MSRPLVLNLTQAVGLTNLRGSKGRSLSMTNHAFRATRMLCLGTAHFYYLTTNGELHHYRYKWL